MGQRLTPGKRIFVLSKVNGLPAILHLRRLEALIPLLANMEFGVPSMRRDVRHWIYGFCLTDADGMEDELLHPVRDGSYGY